MITLETLTTASDKELPKMLGEILQPETGRFHDQLFANEISRFKISPILEQITTECPKCRKWAAKKLIRINERYLQTWYSDEPCVIDHIDTNDWNVSMKWRDWAVEEYGDEAFIEALRMSFMGIGCDCIDVEIPDESVLKWASLDAQPKHYLIAAALCKLNSQ